MNVIDFDMDVRGRGRCAAAASSMVPRPRAASRARRSTAEAVAKLKAMGHVVEGTRQGDAHTICVDPKTGAYIGAEDRRILGKAAGF